MKRGVEHIQEEKKDKQEEQEIFNMGFAVLNQFLARSEQNKLREEMGNQTVQNINNLGSSYEI